MTTAIHTGSATQNGLDGGGWAELRVFAEMYEDAQKARIACTNRAERSSVDPTVYHAQLEALRVAEHQCALALRRCYRRIVPHSIRAWQVETPGIGEHLLARLLGVIGHPIHTTLHEWQPGKDEDRILVAIGTMDRRVSDLWSYCGHGDPARKKRAGMTQAEAFQLGSPRAKMLTRLLAEACIKTGQAKPDLQPKERAPGCNDASETKPMPTPTTPASRRRSPHRDTYDDARERYADRVHEEDCPPCHAGPGEPWRPGHQHSAALRLTGKAILKDLWIAAQETT